MDCGVIPLSLGDGFVTDWTGLLELFSSTYESVANVFMYNDKMDYWNSFGYLVNPR